MAEPKPNRQPPRNGTTYHRPPVSMPHGLNGHGTSAPAREEMYGNDALLLQDIGGSSPENGVSLLGSDAQIQLPAGVEEELEKLRAENQELRCIIAEINHEKETVCDSAQQAWAEREKEYDSLLEEKSDLIRTLHLKIKELQEGAKSTDGRPQNEEELQAIYDELERERMQLDQERRQMDEDRGQLQQDEEALMKQMRDMEMGMSRDRAEMARQRNELQRLHAEIKHELELAARDASLRDRLAPLSRRHQDIANRKGAAPVPEPRASHAAPAQPVAPPPPKKESGLFGRLFGSGR